MEVPKEFERLKQCFWQGIHEEAGDEGDMIRRAFQLLSKEEQSVAKQFVSDLLSANASEAELQSAWRAGGPGYGLYDSHIREFFIKLRDAV